jgi:hypothetical protein
LPEAAARLIKFSPTNPVQGLIGILVPLFHVDSKLFWHNGLAVFGKCRVAPGPRTNANY